MAKCWERTALISSTRAPARYPSKMTNVEEAQFEPDPYPRSEFVYLPKPAGSSRDGAVIWAEARELVREQISGDEYVQDEIGLSVEELGDRFRWAAHFQIDRKKDDQEKA